MKGGSSIARRIAVTCAAICIIGAPATTRAAGVVGTGTAATDAALNAALAGGAVSAQTLLDVNGTLFFVGYGPNSACALWRSDGTPPGTRPVRAFPHLSADDCRFAFLDLTNVNGTLFFCFGESELWRSDGTEAGTVSLGDFGYQGPSHLSALGGTLFFAAVTGADDAHGVELWKSDGTAAGTVLVKDIRPGPDSSFPDFLTDVDGRLYFFAYSGSAYGLWRSDGTEAGTVPVKIFDPQASPSLLNNADGTLFFSVDNADLWKSDATEAGTVPLQHVGTYQSYIADLTNVGGTLFFTVGFHLWKSDGTEAGTVPVRMDLDGVGDLTDVGGTLFFANYTGLWRSDGTEAGTRLVSPGAAGELTNVNGTLLFTADDGSTGVQVWKTDGTAAGTEEISAINHVSPNPTAPSNLTAVNATLFFTAEGGELWKSDRTRAGTGPLQFASATPTPSVVCIGDCTGTSIVAVNDLVTLVNVALGSAPSTACPHGVPSGTDVTIPLISQAVNNALNGCGG